MEVDLCGSRGGMAEACHQLWQGRAGFDRTFNFHSLRHTSLTNAYRATRDIRFP